MDASSGFSVRYTKTLSWLLSLTAGLILFPTAVAGVEPSSILHAQDLHRWAEGPVSAIEINQVFSSPSQVLQNNRLAERPRVQTYPLRSQAPIIGLGMSGVATLKGPRSLVRVVLLDKRSREYLIYEGYPLVTGTNESVVLNDVCRETCILPEIKPSVLRVETIDASIEIESVAVIGAPIVSPPPDQRAKTIKDLKRIQEREIVSTLNEQIKIRGLRWTAGETPISKLSFQEKRKLFPCALMDQGPPPVTVPNLQGFEYYIGGIFEVPQTRPIEAPAKNGASSFVGTFDWRSRHGANDTHSPYYDGDATGGGWMTSVKSQKCADCWAHCVNGAVEAHANLFFNRHLDLDLSEQQLVSCAGAGGWTEPLRGESGHVVP